MKLTERLGSLRMYFTLIVFTMLQTIVLAQDSAVSKTTSTTKVSVTETNSDNWYAAPWVWIVGAALLILLIVALSSSGRRRDSGRTDKVTVTKTVRTDSDVD